MSERYRAVQWNQHKRVFDLVVVGGIASYLIVFVGMTLATLPATQMPSDPVLAIRATGTLAVLMLHVVLLIGPLARLSCVFQVVLYNRRHLGVLTFMVAAVHGGLSLVWYFSGGVYANPLVAALAVAGGPLSPGGIPFHLLGIGALVILLLLAVTSHDFWLEQLGPRVWKWLHMSVYLAYALVIGHVVLGAIQAGRGDAYTYLLGGGFVLVAGLHLIAGIKENSRKELPADESWVDAAAVSDLEDGKGFTVPLKNGRSAALFRDGENIWALSNVCAHQQGPLGEGRIVDGCVTCPWHGHQFRPEDGKAPPPFSEGVPTFRCRVRGDRVLLEPTPQPPGTAREPATISPKDSARGEGSEPERESQGDTP
ncbi:MAG: Rieske 2Fe-2S domain-containing protein [Phycisphaeraceae bacterium]